MFLFHQLKYSLKCTREMRKVTWRLKLTLRNIWLFFFFQKHVLVGARRRQRQPTSTLAWKIPWTEEPDRLQSMGLLRVGHDWATSLSLFTLMHWRRKWQPSPVFLPGESQGRRSLVGYSPGVAKSRTRLSNFTFTFLYFLHCLALEILNLLLNLNWQL